MSQNLIVERQEVGVPPTPVIVKDLYSLDGGVEIQCNTLSDNYVGGVIEKDGEYYPKVLKAGHIVYQLKDGTWWSAGTDTKGFTRCLSLEGESPVLVGVLKHDAIVAVHSDESVNCHGAILLMGAVDCQYMPEGFHGVFEGSATDVGGDIYLNEDMTACNITFLNRKLN